MVFISWFVFDVIAKSLNHITVNSKSFKQAKMKKKMVKGVNANIILQ